MKIAVGLSSFLEMGPGRNASSHSAAASGPVQRKRNRENSPETDNRTEYGRTRESPPSERRERYRPRSGHHSYPGDFRPGDSAEKS
jgi:hypothetical protein